jgi:F-type H+-transporting ATPase subunit b
MMEYEIQGLPSLLAQTEQPVETEAEEHNPILPEADELIFGSLAFLLVFVVLARYAFPRLSQGLQDRREKIQRDLERAEGAKQEAEAVLSRYEEQLQDARSEANRIIDEARKTAESMRRDLLAKAEDESRQVVSKAQEEIRAERDRAFQDLRTQVGELSVELASRIVGQELDRDRQVRLVDEYIEEVAGMGNGGSRKRATRRRSTKKEGDAS